MRAPVRNLFVSYNCEMRPGSRLSLFPRLDLLKLGELYGRAWLLHESRDAGGRERNDDGGIGSFRRHALGGATEGPAQPGKAEEHGCDGADDHAPGSRSEPRYLQIHVSDSRRRSFTSSQVSALATQ